MGKAFGNFAVRFFCFSVLFAFTSFIIFRFDANAPKNDSSTFITIVQEKLNFFKENNQTDDLSLEEMTTIGKVTTELSCQPRQNIITVNSKNIRITLLTDKNWELMAKETEIYSYQKNDVYIIVLYAAVVLILGLLQTSIVNKRT